MPSPFPGMDPYLEDPAIWSGVHAAFLGGIFERLGPAVRPKYAVRFEERVYVTGEDDPGYRLLVPDVRIIERDAEKAIPSPSGAVAISKPVKIPQLADDEIHESSLAIIDIKDRKIVTVIEMLSPTNKVAGSFGRNSFLQKRRETISSDAHWMEIDLLRAGARTANLPNLDTEYHVFLSRAGNRRERFVWPISIREKLPVIGVPLRGDDADIPIDLQAVLTSVIDRGSYDLDMDYAGEASPPLDGEAKKWAAMLIAGRPV